MVGGDRNQKRAQTVLHKDSTVPAANAVTSHKRQSPRAAAAFSAASLPCMQMLSMQVCGAHLQLLLP